MTFRKVGRCQFSVKKTPYTNRTQQNFDSEWLWTISKIFTLFLPNSGIKQFGYVNISSTEYNYSTKMMKLHVNSWNVHTIVERRMWRQAQFSTYFFDAATTKTTRHRLLSKMRWLNLPNNTKCFWNRDLIYFFCYYLYECKLYGWQLSIGLTFETRKINRLSTHVFFPFNPNGSVHYYIERRKKVGDALNYLMSMNCERAKPKHFMQPKWIYLFTIWLQCDQEFDMLVDLTITLFQIS